AHTGNSGRNPAAPGPGTPGTALVPGQAPAVLPGTASAGPPRRWPRPRSAAPRMPAWHAMLGAGTDRQWAWPGQRPPWGDGGSAKAGQGNEMTMRGEVSA